ncbi:hypothetical protein GCM10011409_02260 [Lentibacillus populi]|uniref:Lipopolysaccharide assembly protein A domain-containing protein n=1 Tax=Lentibacillus populi TaxID=1827502 RepID=A0A9W5TTU1_9BACI|nr:MULTISPECIES: lipopolysaccharide assembly protein LapA domain-containing protein [Bacillaceae]MBT2215124.1 DUF1049 domain-containing protein [Virgibacillus dakarensis]GGB28482.1 hypothetical protein GCM10011409_02260 [Lentibacillus populi]
MRSQTYVIFAIIFVIIVAVFAVTNVDVVEVNYLFWSGESPLILVILFSVLMGGIITAAAGVVRMFRLQREIRLLKTENEEMSNLLKKHGLADQFPLHTNGNGKRNEADGKNQSTK